MLRGPCALPRVMSAVYHQRGFAEKGRVVARSMTTSPRLIPSLRTVERTLKADVAYTVSRMRVLERLPGNPLGIGYRWIDE
jgi:hypothetical protein